MKVILYKTNIEKNHVIESIEDYLETCDNVIPNVSNLVNRGIKSRDLRVSMKIPFINDVGMNYLKAYDDNILYYFINNIEWLNDGTSLLDLELDTLNTYQTYVLDSKNYKRVNMKRIHKDRFTKINNNYYRKFDTVDEGFQPDIKTTTSELISKNEISSYIYYRQETTSSNTTAQVLNYRTQPQRWYIEDNDKTTSMGSYKQVFDKKLFNLTSSAHLVYSPGGLTLYYYRNINTYTQIDADAMLIYYPSNTTRLVINIFKLDGDKLIFEGSKEITTSDDSTWPLTESSFSIYGRGPWTFNKLLDASDISYPTFKVGNYYSIYNLSHGTDTTVYYSSDEITRTIKGIKSLNKSDSQIKQITKMYFTMTSEYLCYIGGINPHLEVLQSDDLVTLNNQSINIDAFNYLTLPTNKYIERSKEYESKLYGSYCKNYYINYDNNVLILQPERWNYSKPLLSTTIPLNMCNSIAFNVSGFANKNDYDNWLLCSRNNNLMIYSDEYLEYMRSGYNYDVKAKNQASIKNWSTFGLQAVSSVASVGIAGATSVAGFTSLTANQAVSSSTGLIGTLFNNILSEQKNEDSLNKKKQQAMNATVNISGSDDLLLFEKYNNGGKPRINITQPHEHVEQMEFDLFYYFGYADNTTYAIMPNFKNREYFNYCKCDIEYLKPSLTISQNIIKDIQSKFKDGITFEWKYNNTWLCNGTLYENWEISLNLNE